MLIMLLGILTFECSSPYIQINMDNTVKNVRIKSLGVVIDSSKSGPTDTLRSQFLKKTIDLLSNNQHLQYVVEIKNDTIAKKEYILKLKDINHLIISLPCSSSLCLNDKCPDHILYLHRAFFASYEDTIEVYQKYSFTGLGEKVLHTFYYDIVYLIWDNINRKVICYGEFSDVKRSELLGFSTHWINATISRLAKKMLQCIPDDASK